MSYLVEEHPLDVYRVLREASVGSAVSWASKQSTV